MKALIKQSWCQILPLQLVAGDYDSTEKVLAAIYSSASDCKQIFNKENLRGRLNLIKNQFKKEIDEEEDEDFKSYLRTFPEKIDYISSELGQLLTL